MQITFRIPSEHNVSLRAEAELAATSVAAVARARMRTALTDPAPLPRLPRPVDMHAALVMRVPDPMHAELTRKAADAGMTMSEALRTMVCMPPPGTATSTDDSALVDLRIPAELHEALVHHASTTGESLDALIARALATLPTLEAPIAPATSIYD